MYCQNLQELMRFQARKIAGILKMKGITELKAKEVEALNIIRSKSEDFRKEFCTKHCLINCTKKEEFDEKLQKLDKAVA